MCALSVPEQHQLRIAKQTLRMPDAIAGVMQSGHTSDFNVTSKQGARAFLKRLGWSATRIRKLEE